MGSKAYQGGVSIKVGIIDLKGSLWTPKKTNSSKDEATKNVCPECATNGEAIAGKQFYRCENDHEYVSGDAAKAREVNKELVLVSGQAVIDARTSDLEPNILELSVHSADDLVGKSMVSGSTYVFRQNSKEESKQLGLLIEVLNKRPDLVLMGQMNLRKEDKLFRLTAGLNGQLMLQEMVWPDDLDVFTPPTTDLKAGLLDAAEKFIESVVSEFDPEQYKKAAKERMANLTSALERGETPTPKPVVDTEDDDSLEALLLGAIKVA